MIEHPAFYPNMTALENLEVQGRYLDMDLGKNHRQAILDLLEQVGLPDTGRKRAGAFSLGMKQRLGLAIALIGNPELLILDEPTIGLDPVGVVELRELLLKLNRERNLTIFFSSHNLSERVGRLLLYREKPGYKAPAFIIGISRRLLYPRLILLFFR